MVPRRERKASRLSWKLGRSIRRERIRTQALGNAERNCFPTVFSFAALSAISSDVSVTRKKSFGEGRRENRSIILFWRLKWKLRRLPQEHLSDGKISNSWDARQCNPHFELVVKLVHKSFLLDNPTDTKGKVSPLRSGLRCHRVARPGNNLIKSFGRLGKYSSVHKQGINIHLRKASRWSARQSNLRKRV